MTTTTTLAMVLLTCSAVTLPVNASSFSDTDIDSARGLTAQTWDPSSPDVPPHQPPQGFCAFANIFGAGAPPYYVAYKTATPPVIDGVLDDTAWTEVRLLALITTHTPDRLTD